MAKKLFTAEEAKERQRVTCRIAMRKRRAKSEVEAEAIVMAHQASFAADREAKKLELDPQLYMALQHQRIERQRLINMQEYLIDDSASKLEKEMQLQGEIVCWLEMNPISNPRFWQVYEKLRECEVRMAALKRGRENKYTGGIMEFSTLNFRTA